MRRPALRALLALLVAAAGAGCQDYNFNPVGKCLIQPSTARVKLAEVGAADVLFVVDESGSMGGEQQKLADNFDSFIQNLDLFNETRVDDGLDPFEFHIAVTTTSVAWNQTLNATCRSDCGTSAGVLVCCGNSSGAAIEGPKRCESNADCDATASMTCQTTCDGNKGTRTCCAADGTVQDAPIACTLAGAPCGSFTQQYPMSLAGCDPGVGVAEWPYAAGDFVSFEGNPRILHFDAGLYAESGPQTNRQGYTRDQLKQFFAGGGGGGNVLVGTCGSGQEQALLAARRAVEKALRGEQRDTVDLAGNATWDPVNRVAGSTAEWPHDGAKLVVVIVGDEDDCSSADGEDGPTGLVMIANQGPGQDACSRDAALPEDQRKQVPVGDFVDYFTGLGRPLGAAFIVSTEQVACGREGLPPCSAGMCVDSGCVGPPNECGAQAAAYRLVNAAQGLLGQGADVVTGSICDANFGTLLDEIANVVRPPSGLVLPTEPAESVVTLLRIADDEGQTRKICTGPAPVGLTVDQAEMEEWDWWFTPAREKADPVAVSRFVYINQDSGDCLANPGETYSADYIGLLPAGGCANRDECRATLGGRFEDWGCYVPPGASRGTCICCASGSTDPACQ